MPVLSGERIVRPAIGDFGVLGRLSAAGLLAIAAAAPTATRAQTQSGEARGGARSEAPCQNRRASPCRAARPRMPGSLRPLSQTGPYPHPVLPFEPLQPEPEPAPTENLASAIEQAWRTNPTLAAQRYELRATDENLAQAMAQLRATSELQVTGNYDQTFPGDIAQAARPVADQIADPNPARNGLGAQLIVDQRLSTGGKAHADIEAAGADIRAGREALRGSEGDLLVRVIDAYASVRRDTGVLAIRRTNVRVLDSILKEVSARRTAGELTRTDVAQAETQLASAEVQLNSASEQLEQSRAAYAALVGENPGALAPEPDLPQLPATIDAAFAQAERDNPDLAQAIQAEQASRARIAAARAAGRPTLTLRGTVGFNGQAFPFSMADSDKSVSGRALLTIPLVAGGRTSSLTAQAQDRNAADRLRIEAARRQMVQNIVAAWNQMVTARRNYRVQQEQLKSVAVLNEGMYAEYRAGLRSTFDVLFAQNNLRDTQIGLLASRRDLYLAEATLLRHIGKLEVSKLMTGTALYDPAGHVHEVGKRGSRPWDGAARSLDALFAPLGKQQAVELPARAPETPKIAPAGPAPDEASLAQKSPTTPIPGTAGAPARRKKH